MTRWKIVAQGMALALALSLFAGTPLAQNTPLPLLWTLLSGAGMFLFCQRRSGRLGAVLGSLLYVYSPNLLHATPYAGAVFTELLAFALFPWLLWRADALRDYASGSNVLKLALLQIALSHTHATLAALLTALAVLWVLMETTVQAWNREASQMQARDGAWAILALSLGALAASGVWLPPLLEGAALPSTLQGTAIRLQAQPAALHVALAALGLLSALLLYIRGYRSRHPQALLGCGIFALAALLAGLALWADTAPGRGTQSWWLLGLLSAALATVGSMNGIWMERLQGRLRLPLIALLLALVPVAALPNLLQVHGLPAPLDPIGAAPQLALLLQGGSTDIPALPSLVGLALLLLYAWWLQRRRSAPRPYAHTPPLTASAIRSLLLAWAIVALYALALQATG